MYFLKTKGDKHSQDYIQVRNDDFILTAYYPVHSIDKLIEEFDSSIGKEEIRKVIEELPYGTLKKINLLCH